MTTAARHALAHALPVQGGPTAQPGRLAAARVAWLGRIAAALRGTRRDRVGRWRRGRTGALAACAIVCCLAVIRPANAAISVDSVATAVSASQVTSLSWSHTVGAGSNQILIVGISFRDGNVSASGVSLTTASVPQALTRIGFINAGGSQNRTELWYLLAPPTGVGTVAVSMSASKMITAGSISFNGVNQSTPLGTFVSATAQSTAASVTVASATGQVVIDTVTANGDAVSLAVGALQTQRWNLFSSTGDAGSARGAGSTEPGAASTTMSWTLGVSKPWSIGAVPLIPAAVTPAFVNLKTVQVTSDPINGTTNPKLIPGAYALYTVQITNTAAGSPDSNSVFIYDPVPANTTLFVGNLGAVGSGPVAFTDGTPASGLTYTFTSLASTTDDVDFSNNGGVSYAYTPVPDGSGFDANVTNIRINPKGVFAAAGGSNPYFQVSFRVKVK
jgi:hypothetical protein